MIDAETLAYDFDEEAHGFGEPPRAAAQAPLPLAQRGALALVGLGLVALAAQAAGGPLAGTWTGLASSFGLLAAGASLHFWLDLRGTTPGIKHDGVWFRGLFARGAAGWTAGVAMTAFYVLIYWFPAALGHSSAGEPTGLVRVVDPLARALTGYPASQWFLYGVLYTLAMAIFAVRMAMKYRHSRHQLARTGSVVVCQTLFAWLLPNILVRLRYPYMEFNGVWPLKQDYLWPDKTAEFLGAGTVGIALLALAVALVVATPVLTYFLGKRWYCSWVCGCGGLAETLGDPWRQLSDTSTRAWKIERWSVHGVLVLVVVSTLALWLDHLTGWFGGALHLKQWYGFAIGAVFSGVAGVGLYPLLGNRVWCRFGCPQAAILGLWQRFFSRFRITTNGEQCMSCGNCSTYCEMGIDVRSYAQRGEDIVRASCVGCGVCTEVCPRGVLKLENGATHADRYESSDEPLTALKKSLGLAEWDAKR
jgi:ferredoxin-type protein NapH